MKFAKLFPPTTNDNKEEHCTIAQTTFNIKDLNYNPIPETNIQDTLWVDGGSAVLFTTPARTLGIIKISTINTSGLERTNVATHTYLVSITNSNSTFLIRNQPINNPDDKITTSLNRDIERTQLPPETTPEILLDMMRTIAEHTITTNNNSIRDGSIRTLNHYLQQELREIHTCNIAKTTSMLTNQQRPIGLALIMHAPPGQWYTNATPTTTFARLHHRAAHVFLIENATPTQLATLTAWSNDISFPGYPYPLILADQLARVTNNERDTWKMILKNDEEAMTIINSEQRANECHAILEHILYGKPL